MQPNNRFLLPLVIALGLVSLATVGFLVWRGVQRPQSAVPSQAASPNLNSDPNKCQGNPNSSAKCFKCETGSNKNNPVGILDFSCFRNFYGKTVGSDLPSNAITKKIQLLIFNPVVTNDQKLVDYQKWNNPDALTSQLISDFKELSGSFVNYQVVERIEINDFGQKIDGFNYTPTTYLQCWSNHSLCHSPDGVDYNKILAAYQSCEKRNSGQIDEVWLWGAPWFGYYESRLAGPNAFWYNSPPLSGTTCQKLLPIMGFNYERGIGEAMESYGHRVESVMRQTYGGWDSKNGTTPWDIFTRREIDVVNQSRCGNIHYAPASLTDYDWGNTRTVKSACDDFLLYPNLPNPPNFRNIQCSVWDCNGYQFKKWWFNHLPKTTGKTGGKLNNWWSYIVDYDNTINQ